MDDNKMDAMSLDEVVLNQKAQKWCRVMLQFFANGLENIGDALKTTDEDGNIRQMTDDDDWYRSLQCVVGLCDVDLMQLETNVRSMAKILQQIEIAREQRKKKEGAEWNK